MMTNVKIDKMRRRNSSIQMKKMKPCMELNTKA